MSSHVAHQFDDAQQQSEAGTLGLWIFLISEMMFFGGMFTGFLYYRHLYFQDFQAASHEMGVWLGTLNTGILITSSLCIALSVWSMEKSSPATTIFYLVCTLLLGILFLGIKFYEYAEKWKKDLVPGAQFSWKSGESSEHAELFYTFYFTMTGMHALHMVIGISAVAVLAWMWWRTEETTHLHNVTHNIGLYWHFVDIVWIFLFPLLYLISG